MPATIHKFCPRVALPAAPGVYRIFIPGTNKSYVGSSVNIRNRFWNHKADIARGKSTRALRHAAALHGIDSFHCEVLELCHGDQQIAG